MRHISNSEVGTWLSCRNKYRYNFDLNLQPNKSSDPLSKGTLGHEVLAIYYSNLKKGLPHETAKVAATEWLTRQMSTGIADWSLDIIVEVRRILELYWLNYEGDPNWEILQVEEAMDLPLNDEYSMPGRLDLLVRERDTGKVMLVDHKFFYDMPSQSKVNLSVQFPKYVGALANSGIKVDGCIINILRTRKMKAPVLSDLYRRIPVVVSNAKIRNSLRTHILASEEISEYRSLPDEVRPSRAIPVFNDMICKSCSYSSLCESEFDGGDITYLITSDYKPNTYGYNNEPTIEEGLL